MGRKLVLIVVMIFLSSFFFGCGAGDNQKYASSGDTITTNGIRSDVEQYITSVYPNSAEKRTALISYAKALQTAYTTVSTQADAINMEPQIINALASVSKSSSGYAGTLQDPAYVVGKKTSNTPERLAAQLKYEKLLDGKVFIIPSLGDATSSLKMVYSASSACSSSNYLVVHINGINTLKEDARLDAMNVLSPAIGSLHDGENVEVIVAYNQTHGAMDDLVDVFRQKIGEYPNVSSDLIFGALASGVFGSNIPQSLKDFISNYHMNKIKDSGFTSYNDDDLRDIVGAIRAKIIENEKVLLVPHSQGNIYANAAYGALTNGDNAISKSAIGIFGIASPAAYVAGNGSYLTSSNDLVVAGLRSSGLSVLPTNFTISLSTDDILGHSLSGIYMNSDLQGRAEITKRIYAAMDALSSSGENASQGPITATLTWGARSDVDLHVFEPSGTHVYYANNIGTVGYLDIDNMIGYGPEHYFTSCDSLKIGTYNIGVNYFSGLLPEIATVTISTPSLVSTRTVNLPIALGSVGNNSQIMVGTVTVTQNADGKYVFQLN